MTVLYEKSNDYTESDFLEFINTIYFAKARNENEHDFNIEEFERITEHPAGSDLFYFPEEGKSGPIEIFNEIKRWRKSHGLPLFKDSK
ncbi:bacteriocin immunity protein [Buttiauxella sp. WJP83]|uniref:bacteriocin immunity protein n=1 Tax=Buttiauxella sp. WJP83 TaxID=2986951 RepID=UPI0022DE36E1|nr:bacteriocin immunity protein [Buttiauxella sp. WJP83]WBM72281.1 bacteriocin immunity protein [Buttiauxella sp. WJP83]